jgi:hypothetical protein
MAGVCNNPVTVPGGPRRTEKHADERHSERTLSAVGAHSTSFGAG